MKISDAEMEMMEILWKAGEPIVLSQILSRYQPRWKPTTISTMLKRLTEKGYVKSEDSNPKQTNSKKSRVREFAYSTTLTKEEYLQQQTDEFISNLFAGSYATFAQTLVGSNKISEEEMDEIRKLLK